MKSIDWKNATPEQILLWKHASALIAWNTLTPLHYTGLIAGSEFETYAATKLYIALELEFSHNDSGGGIYVHATEPYWVALYNENNTLVRLFEKVNITVDTVLGIIGFMNDIFIKNQYFGRIETPLIGGTDPTYLSMKFSGYKLSTI